MTDQSWNEITFSPIIISHVADDRSLMFTSLFVYYMKIDSGN